MPASCPNIYLPLQTDFTADTELFAAMAALLAVAELVHLNLVQVSL